MLSSIRTPILIARISLPASMAAFAVKGLITKFGRIKEPKLQAPPYSLGFSTL